MELSTCHEVESTTTSVAYDSWLATHGVYCHEAIVTTRTGVVSGFGCVATRKLRRGEVLFRVPRGACFGPDPGAAIDAEAPGDTQQRFAARLIEETRKGAASEWAPLLSVLTPAPCPWIWPEAALRFLDGTELQEVLKRKQKRMRLERRELGLPKECAREYAEACALVASHLNPWFGGSVTPVNCTLNYSAAPTVEFEAEGCGTVVARALRTIRPGEELTQEYCESTAMFVYRYGFSPAGGTAGGGTTVGDGTSGALARMAPPLLPEDAVSLRADALAAAAATPASSLSARLSWLVAAGCLGECPWDGLDEIVTAELLPDGAGSAKLVAACLILTAEPSRWAKAAKAAEAVRANDGGARGGAAARGGATKISNDDNSSSGGDDDALAAALVASIFSLGTADASALALLATAEGGDEADPWPALLRSASGNVPCAAAATTAAAVDSALECAREAVCARRQQLLDTAAPVEAAAVGGDEDGPEGGSMVGQGDSEGRRSHGQKRRRAHATGAADTVDTGFSIAEAARMAMGLRVVELAILESAARRLEAASPTNLGVLA